MLEEGIEVVVCAPPDEKLLALSESARQVYGFALLGETRPAIAEKLGITRQRVSQLVKYLHRLGLLPAEVLPENPNMTRKSRFQRAEEALKDAPKSVGFFGRILR